MPNNGIMELTLSELAQLLNFERRYGIAKTLKVWNASFVMRLTNFWQGELSRAEEKLFFRLSRS